MKEKIEFILEVMPKVEKIIGFATEDQIDKLFIQAQQKLDYELTEACFE